MITTILHYIRIYASLSWVIIGSDNGLSPVRRQAIIWTNAGILSIEPLGTNFSETIIGIQRFSFGKLHLNMSSAKWRPFCLGLNVLMDLLIVPFYNILFVYTWNDFSWLIMCDYTVWIVFYDLFALSENDEIKMINQLSHQCICHPLSLDELLGS